MSELNLDDPKIFKKYDPEGMLTCLHEMPEHCRKAWQMAMEFDIPRDYDKVSRAVILGMGGSAIGGDLAGGLAAAESSIPILTIRGYDLPAFVDGETLVIASSYSGMTEETLSAFGRALKTGAKKLAITTGGRLQEIARQNDIPVFLFSYKAQPRAALPYSLLPIIGILQKLGFTGDKSSDVAEMVKGLQELSRRIDENAPESDNPAKKLAKRLYGRLAVVYGAGIVSAVANRWKTQLNENSKAWAFHEVFPELNHNAVVGYRFPKELAGKAMVALLHSELLPERVRLRYRVTCQLLEQAKADYQIVEGEGSSALSQMMGLVLLGDYVSYYLAMLNEIDPTPVKSIDYLKGQLGKDKEVK